MVTMRAPGSPRNDNGDGIPASRDTSPPSPASVPAGPSNLAPAATMPNDNQVVPKPKKRPRAVKFARVPKRPERGLGCAKCRYSANGCNTCGYYEDEAMRAMQVEKEERRREEEARRRRRAHAGPSGPKREEHPCAFERAKRRVQSQISRIRQETWLLETYETEGWRGASKEKLKPELELQRARAAVERCKQRIMDQMRFIQEGGGFQRIPAEKFNEDGSIDEGDIFCAKCLGGEATEENDIVLCDGYCGRAYHLMCLEPPLRMSDLPPDDEGWLCPSCSARVDCVFYLNQLLDTAMPLNVDWRDIFAHDSEKGAEEEKEKVNGAGGFLDLDLPSEESEDEDFAAASSSSSSSSSSSEEDEVAVVVTGKRRRQRVDYAKLNEAMFGGTEAYEGELVSDQEWDPSARSPTPQKKTKRKRGRPRKHPKPED